MLQIKDYQWRFALGGIMNNTNLNEEENTKTDIVSVGQAERCVIGKLTPDENKQYEQRDHLWYSNAAFDITAERRRQIEQNGYDYFHDDEHTNNELVDAALAFAYIEQDFWPWGLESWKKVLAHNHSKRDMLVRAAALLMAEIERIDRQAL